MASDHILRYCRDSHLDSLTYLEAGKAEVLEIVCPEGSRAVGVPMHRLNLPRGTLVGAIVRRERVVIPRGNDIIRAGDTVIVLTRAAGRAFVERLFRPGVR